MRMGRESCDLDGLLAVIVPRSFGGDDTFPFPILTPRQISQNFTHLTNQSTMGRDSILFGLLPLSSGGPKLPIAARYSAGRKTPTRPNRPRG